MKRGLHRDATKPDVGRTQHSTLTAGENVASAAISISDGPNRKTIYVSSGHYQPGPEAAFKLAIAGKKSGHINRRNIDFHAYQNSQANNLTPVSLTMKERIRTVNEWKNRRR